MAITPLPSVPLRSDGPDAFVTKADAFLKSLNQFATECDALGVAMTLAATNSTSTTSLLIGTGSKSLTVQTAKSYVVGMTVKIASTANGTIWMLGDITSYTTGTGALVVNVTALSPGATGTFAAWTISQSVPSGAQSGANSDITSLLALGTAIFNIGAGQFYKSVAGDIGIGTTTPTAKLSVNGTLSTTGAITSGGDITLSGSSAIRQSPGSGGFVNNICIGSQALSSNTTGTGIVAIGYQALQSNLIGIGNTAIGSQSLRLNTSGNNNTAIGANTLSANTTGSGNLAVGQYALISNTTGADNTAVGRSSLVSNTTGSFNLAVGQGALNGNTTGTYNVAFGLQTLAGNTVGTTNTAIGYGALSGNTTSSGCVGIGALCTSSSLTVQNEVNIYNQACTARFQGVATSWSFVSDIRDKEDIKDLTLGLDFITKLKPRIFKWNLRHTNIDKGKEASGFIAQEVLKVVEDSDAIYSGLVDTNDKNQYTLAQTNLIPMLVNAIKELKAEIDNLKGAANA